MKRERLDNLLVQRQLCPTLKEAHALILAGEVWSGEKRLDKAGTSLPVDIVLEVRSKAPAFSSRAGGKLEHALRFFGIQVERRVCADVGSSTGGFTDCLLKAGAKLVFSIDVGYGLLDQKLRLDPRVVVVERTNARTLKLSDLTQRNPQADEVSLVVADVSFISLRKIIEPLRLGLAKAVDWVLLFKPQFEVGPEHLEKGGVVKDLAVTKKALEEFDVTMKELGFSRIGPFEPSPLPGKRSGNTEFLLHYRLGSNK